MRTVASGRVLFVLLILTSAAATAQEPNLDIWQRIPVMDSGRRMPLNTFALSLVERICGKENPTLSLDGAADADGKDPPAALSDEAKRLFPGGGPRRFTAAELLLSWLVEPQRWECVPFLFAGNEELRVELLGLPVKNAHGERLRYVSPWQVRQAIDRPQSKFRRCLERLQGDGDEKAKPTTAEEKAQQLYNACVVFQLVTFDPRDPGGSHQRFLEKLQTVAVTWLGLSPTIRRFAAIEAGSPMAAALAKTDAALAEILDLKQGAPVLAVRDLARKGVDVKKIDPPLGVLEETTGDLARQVAELRTRLFAKPPEGAGEDERQLRKFRAQMHALAATAAELPRQIRQARMALFDNGNSLRLVPALEPDALERNRRPEDDVPTWLSLQTLLAGSAGALRGYPSEHVNAVREAFEELTRAYADRGDSGRAKRVEAALGQFAGALRTLGEGVESARKNLPIRDRDDELIAATAYPAAGSTNIEVFYSRLDPFLWSWVISFFAMVCVGLAVGMFRKPMFWSGLAMLAAAQAFTALGLGLRVYVTGWAPVTNMFETIIFVAFVVGSLSLWFTLLPLFGPGLAAAWRMTAVPATPEAAPLTDDQRALAREETWNTAGWVLAVPRLALALIVAYVLTAVSYGEGKYHTIVGLVPRIDVGSHWPTLGNLVVWLVGMCMLGIGMWLLPRLATSAVVGLGTVPRSLVCSGLAGPAARVVVRKPFLFAGVAVAFFAAVVAYFSPLEKGINPLMPVLRSNLWLTLHVLTITSSYGAGALAWGLALIALGHYLFGSYREPAMPGDWQEDDGQNPLNEYAAAPDTVHRRPPEICATLGGYLYRTTQVAVLLLAAGTILGGLWADVSWGRFWGWDSKEVWALISTLLYLAILHGRYVGWFGNFGLAVGSVLGATSILMAWYGVNFVLGSGRHSYGAGTGGMFWALLLVGLNWLFLLAAGARYWMETSLPAATSPPIDLPTEDSLPTRGKARQLV